MSRIKLTIQYTGTNYHGWQTQSNGITIQEVLEKTLLRILSTPIKVHGSGRTDAGVHALAQVAHFDLPLNISFPLKKLHYGLNSLLPKDIVVLSLEKVPNDFHAQLSAKKKTYEYTILNSFIRSPFIEDYSWRIPYKLHVEKMKRAAKYLEGEHDFKAFTASDGCTKTTVRRVYGIKIIVDRNGKGAGGLGLGVSAIPYTPYPILADSRVIKISLTGNGFLKHMVRNIVGTLVQVGRGKMTLVQFKKVLKGKDRRKAGCTAPAKGLILKDVSYR